MKSTIYILIASAVLGSMAQAAPVLTVEMKIGRLTADNKIISVDKETDTDVATLRLRATPDGRVFLLKAKKEGDYLILSRKVHLQQGGQYLIKNDKVSGLVATVASGKIDPQAWEASTEAKDFFASPPHQVKPVPSETPAGTIGQEVKEEPKLADISLPTEPTPKLLSSSLANPLPNISQPESVSTPNPGYFTEQTRPHAGAETFVYPIGTGMEPDYTAQPGDTLDITFYRVQRVTVDMKGDVRLVSLVGNAEAVVPAAGKTADEIAKQAANSGLDFKTLANPTIKVKVSSFAESTVIVLGDMKRVGRLKIDPSRDFGIREVISSMGGLTIPERSAIIFVKRGERVIKIDMASSNKDAIDKFQVSPGDIITISRSR